MAAFDIFIFIMMGVGVVTMIFLFFAKKRMDNNEPILGWRRKQYLQEQHQAQNGETHQKTKQKSKKVKSEQSIKDLIGIKDIRYGIFEKEHNEYCVIIGTDSVNFDLLAEGSKSSIILGYQSLFRVIRFPVQILGQAVRQDLRKEEQRWKENLELGTSQTKDYNNKVIEHIKNRSEKEFRISRRVFYVLSYQYETSRMGALTPEQKEKKIMTELYMRARTVIGMLRRSRIESGLLDSLSAMEVLKRSLNRDRMLSNPIENVVMPGKEKLSAYVTADVTTLPGYEELVYDVEEVREDVRITEEEERERYENEVEEQSA